ncbi:MAG TPA: hypothetical protein VE986_06295 [Hyphomicrobiales bacterium]|nr:hypothetical protein [Hyphomicrobiales bacterium]
MELIYQKGEHDCAIAAIAMAASKSYEEVYGRFGCYARAGRTPGVQIIKDWFEDQGFHIEMREFASPAFAENHVVKVMWRCPHYVAMDAAGKVYDPYPPYIDLPNRDAYAGDHGTLDHPDFTEIFWIMGLTRKRS